MEAKVGKWEKMEIVEVGRESRSIEIEVAEGGGVGEVRKKSAADNFCNLNLLIYRDNLNPPQFRLGKKLINNLCVE